MQLPSCGPLFAEFVSDHTASHCAAHRTRRAVRRFVPNYAAGRGTTHRAARHERHQHRSNGKPQFVSRFRIAGSCIECPLRCQQSTCRSIGFARGHMGLLDCPRKPIVSRTRMRSAVTMRFLDAAAHARTFRGGHVT
jgi:hypothetical protein